MLLISAVVTTSHILPFYLSSLCCSDRQLSCIQPYHLYGAPSVTSGSPVVGGLFGNQNKGFGFSSGLGTGTAGTGGFGAGLTGGGLGFGNFNLQSTQQQQQQQGE